MSLVPPFPSADPYDSGFLPVSEVHTLYYEQYGNPDGIPLVCLHGGPGAAIDPPSIRCIDPTLYRVIAFDQRGCGRSTPFGCTDENTTEHLIADIELLREHFEIDKWVVTGRSWGATLALAYGIQHTAAVAALVPVSVFLGRQRDINWLYQDGASAIFPEDWAEYVSIVPVDQRHDILGFYHRLLLNGSDFDRASAARRLALWELATVYIQRDDTYDKYATDDDGNLAIGIMETHYLSQGCFLPSDNWILENTDALASVPGRIVHGRYDMDCRVEQAWLLQQQWPVPLHVAEDSGHAQSHPGLTDAVIQALRSVAADLT